MAQRPALTTTEALHDILSQPVAARNRRARQAVDHILDGAASPMEARLAMLLCLPTAMGGYALPKPTLNPEVTLDANARALYPHLVARPDLFWEEKRLDVEYDGDAHEGGESRAKDAGRLAALEVEGITVVTLTYPQVASALAFDVVARRIGRMLGAPVRIRMKNDGHARRRLLLREELGLMPDGPSLLW